MLAGRRPPPAPLRKNRVAAPGPADDTEGNPTTDCLPWTPPA
jgi:hypothetical protein